MKFRVLNYICREVYSCYYYDQSTSAGKKGEIHVICGMLLFFSVKNRSPGAKVLYQWIKISSELHRMVEPTSHSWTMSHGSSLLHFTEIFDLNHHMNFYLTVIKRGIRQFISQQFISRPFILRQVTAALKLGLELGLRCGLRLE